MLPRRIVPRTFRDAPSKVVFNGNARSLVDILDIIEHRPTISDYTFVQVAHMQDDQATSKVQET